MTKKVTEETHEEKLRRMEAKLRHAIIYDTIRGPEGQLEHRVHHYLTCEKCRLRRILKLPYEAEDVR